MWRPLPVRAAVGQPHPANGCDARRRSLQLLALGAVVPEKRAVQHPADPIPHRIAGKSGNLPPPEPGTLDNATVLPKNSSLSQVAISPDPSGERWALAH